jgi:hypothetical protein
VPKTGSGSPSCGWSATAARIPESVRPVFCCRNGRVERVEPPFGVGRGFLEFFLGT